MSRHIEWVHAGHATPTLVDADVLEEDSPDGNEDEDVAIDLGTYDGAYLYGQPSEVVAWLEKALKEAKKRGWTK